MYGQGGITKTKKAVQKLLWWLDVLKDVTDHVKRRHSCQVNKSSTQKPAGMLHPLPIPDHTWEVVTKDIIMQLPKTNNGHTDS